MCDDPTKLMREIAAVFLTPAGILIGALGVAKTEGLKTGVSTVGLILSLLWFLAYDELGESTSRAYSCLPLVFAVTCVVSFCIHSPRFLRQLTGSTKIRVGKDIIAALGGEPHAAALLKAQAKLPPAGKP